MLLISLLDLLVDHRYNVIFTKLPVAATTATSGSGATGARETDGEYIYAKCHMFVSELLVDANTARSGSGTTDERETGD